MRSAVPIALLVLAMAGTAAAQPGVTSPSFPPPQPMQQPGEELSETTALLLSLGGTAASWGLIAVAIEMDDQGISHAGAIGTIGALGTFFAPSFGHLYAHSFTSRGLGLRSAGVVAVLVAGMIAVEEGVTGNSNPHPVEAFLIAGAGLYVGGTIDDIVTAPGEARRYNHRFGNVAIVPMIRGDNSGFMITGRF
jgi:hypothetical protein